MNKKIPIASTTFGVGNEHLALSAAEGDGISDRRNYSQESDTAGEQAVSRRSWQKKFGDTKIVHELAVSPYHGINLWAECVRKAGSVRPQKQCSRHSKRAPLLQARPAL